MTGSRNTGYNKIAKKRARVLFSRIVRLPNKEPGMKIITKFGGSSLADASQFNKVMAILRENSGRIGCVPSAPGKRYSKDDKITDLLYAFYDNAKTSQGEQSFAPIRERFTTLCAEVAPAFPIDTYLSRVYEDVMAGASQDYAASRGEYLNGLLLAAALGWEFIDAAEVIFFTPEGHLDAEKTNRILGARIQKSGRFVLPGFYGSRPDGTVQTFSRGGSDITGSIAARAANADLYENWTDVSGFLVTDPRIVHKPHTIRTITYRELRELSYMGATVLHEDAIFPVRTAGIPINIRNTNCPSDLGTMIVAEVEAEGSVTGIAGKRNFTVITLEKDRMNIERGFGRRVLQALEQNGISFEHLPTGIDTMSVVLSDQELSGREDSVLQDIHTLAAPDSLVVERNLALIAVVGRGMVRAVGTASRIFAALAEAGINVRMIDQGSSELNIIVGVDNADFERGIREIYRAFFG